MPAVWAFNTWGTVDLLFAVYQGEIGVRIDPGALGAAFFIPTVLVPPLLILHGLVFWRLVLGVPGTRFPHGAVGEGD